MSIPKKIHYCWFGGNPLPELAQKCIDSWKKYLPDYEIIRWDESNFDFSLKWKLSLDFAFAIRYNQCRKNFQGGNTMKPTKPIALQLYSVRFDMAEDFYGTLKKVADMGYDGVEFAGFYGEKAEDVKKACDELGLVPISSHVVMTPLLIDELDAQIEYHKTLGCKYIVMPYADENYRPGGPEFPSFITTTTSNLSNTATPTDSTISIPQFPPNISIPRSTSAGFPSQAEIPRLTSENTTEDLKSFTLRTTFSKTPNIRAICTLLSTKTVRTISTLIFPKAKTSISDRSAKVRSAFPQLSTPRKNVI